MHEFHLHLYRFRQLFSIFHTFRGPGVSIIVMQEWTDPSRTGPTLETQTCWKLELEGGRALMMITLLLPPLNNSVPFAKLLTPYQISSSPNNPVPITLLNNNSAPPALQISSTRTQTFSPGPCYCQSTSLVMNE